nr:glucose-6-phosphate 1-epimerase [Quercus suber]
MERANRPSALSPSATGPQPSVHAEQGRVYASLPTGDSVEILLFGATVTSWKSNGKENLWLSSGAKMDGSKPVRGGVPLVFPCGSTWVAVHAEQGRVYASLPTGDSVEILLFGATVTSWKSNGKENLWLSSGAKMDGSKPVFGPPPKDHATSALPQHGFARNSVWEYLGSSSSESGALSKGADDSVKLDFGLSQAQLSAESKKAWPFDFALVYSVTLGKDGLQTMLNVQNKGEKSFDFQMLLHTYFRVKVRPMSRL